MVASPRPGRFAAGGLALLLLGLLTLVLALRAEDYPASARASVLHHSRPALREALPGGLAPERLADVCFPDRAATDTVKVVGGRVGGRVLHACYRWDADDYLWAVVITDAAGHRVGDPDLIKQAGMWPLVGMVNSADDVVWVGVWAAAALLVGTGYYRSAAYAPETGWPSRVAVLWPFLLVPVIGWLLLAAVPRVTGARKRWLVWRAALVTAAFSAVWPLLAIDGRTDLPTFIGVLLVPAAFAYAVLAGRAWLHPGGIGAGASAPKAPAGPEHPLALQRPALERTLVEAPWPPAPLAPVPHWEGPPAPAPAQPPAPAPVAEARPVTGGARPAALAALTNRELEVLAHVATGLSNAEIAERLVVSEATVKTHVARVLTKLGLANRVQAALVAYRAGLVDVEPD
jgi:DNA-binding CsgD family transcriptional regulator